jgi:M6 family metalloprotease-like protein
MSGLHTPRLLLIILAISLATGGASSSTDDLQCGLQSMPARVRQTADIGGRHLPARGTLRVLVVFASFPDDETSHPFWPSHQPPLFMRQFVDPDTLTRSTEPFNLTHYFHEMSLGQFHLVGDVIWLESTHAQNEYRNWPYGRMNNDIIRERLDSLVDFSQYDHWARFGDYDIREQPDGIVDMIIMVWRTTMYEYLGEASLGYMPQIPVDGGSRYVWMGYPERYDVPKGSGVTCEYPYSDTPGLVLKTIAHEFAHWLLGGLHPYSTQLAGKHQFWGVLCSGERLSSCMNAYEREALGWITVPEIDAGHDIVLRDFVKTGDALKFHPPNGEGAEFFYIENHQKLSVFDDATLNPSDKGVWVLHQEHQYLDLDNLRIRPSDGNWKWENPSTSSACFGAAIPVFRRGEPRTFTGETHRDQIPTKTSYVNWMYAVQEDSVMLRCAAFAGGEGLYGAFDTSFTPVFSPYSNPNSNTWTNLRTDFAVEVLGVDNGEVKLRRYADPLDASPSRRYLGADPSQQAGGNQVSLAWGSQWSEGQSIEADVVSSWLVRRIDGGPWDTVYSGAATAWNDGGIRNDSAGTHTIAYRVRVVDSQGKQSTWSNTFTARGSIITSVPDGMGSSPGGDRLGEPYPNPCNPMASIRYTVGAVRSQSPVVSNVRLVVYDMLGRAVAVLINERKEPGTYTARFDGTGLAGGVYFCKLVVGYYSETRKIVLLK